MAGTQPRKTFPQRLASSSTRGVAVGSSPAGLRRVRRAVDGQAGSDDVWVVVEPEADIAAKGHPYISFDPDGTYP